MSFGAPNPGNEGPVSGGLQFDRAEPLLTPDAADSATRCVACQQPIAGKYYHAQGQTVCEFCAHRIESGQQAPPAISLPRAALYGACGALAGCLLYAAVAIITGWEIGLVAIVVGVLVGKAVRKGSHDLGGRPQQILAVLLTYFAITTSYIPVFIYGRAKASGPAEQTSSEQQGQAAPGGRVPADAGNQQAPMSLGKALFVLLLLAAAAPFLSLGSGVSAFISLFIIFIGLQQAWKLTGRAEILIMGPYDVNPAQ